MGDKLTAGRCHQSDISLVKLVGVIDDDNNLEALSVSDAAHIVVVHMREVERITSAGVRDLLRWLRGESSKRTVVLSECSTAIVAELSLVREFCAVAYVDTFAAPYFCTPCGTETVRIIGSTQVDTGAPAQRCQRCDAELSLEDEPESYFAFLAGNTIPASIDGRRDELRRMVAEAGGLAAGPIQASVPERTRLGPVAYIAGLAIVLGAVVAAATLFT